MRIGHCSWPPALALVLASTALLALAGLGGGLALLADPSGGVLAIPVSLLEGLPIRDYTLPGAFLVVVMGAVPAFVLYALCTRLEWEWAERHNPFRDEHWSWTAALTLCAAFLVWLALEFALLGYHAPFQVAAGLQGLLTLGLLLLDSVRSYYWEF